MMETPIPVSKKSPSPTRHPRNPVLRKLFSPCYAILFTCICIAGLISCAQSEKASTRGPTPGSAAPAIAALNTMYPASRASLATTSASIYMANLNSRIETIDSARASQPDSIQLSTLATLLYYRYRIEGRIEDAEQALEVADNAIEADSSNGDAWHVRAIILAGLHRFNDALRDLRTATEAGVSKRRLSSLHGEIMLALGRYDAVPELDASPVRAASGFHHAVLLGNLAMMNGRLDLASARFLEAQQLYADSSPFQLAWLHTQQGIALLRSGNCSSATRFFEAAIARVPTYYLAAEHLAECERAMGQVDRARSRYLAVIEQTRNPEFIGALAELEQASGNTNKAEALFRQAETTWNERLSMHPEAFSDHAVGFFASIGKTDRALALSRSNMKNRRDVLSLLLHASANFESGRLADACGALRGAIGTGLKPPEMREFERQAARCGLRLRLTKSDSGS